MTGLRSPGRDPQVPAGDPQQRDAAITKQGAKHTCTRFELVLGIHVSKKCADSRPPGRRAHAIAAHHDAERDLIRPQQTACSAAASELSSQPACKGTQQPRPLKFH